MPLYIKDPRVAAMAERLRRLTDAASKTEAVLRALESALEEQERLVGSANRGSIATRIDEAVIIARRIGRRHEEFDQKAFSDEMWGV